MMIDYKKLDSLDGKELDKAIDTLSNEELLKIFTFKVFDKGLEKQLLKVLKS